MQVKCPRDRHEYDGKAQVRPCCLKNFNFEILCLDIVCLHVLWLVGKFQKAFVMRNAGLSGREISRRLGFSPSVVSRLLNKFYQTNAV